MRDAKKRKDDQWMNFPSLLGEPMAGPAAASTANRSSWVETFTESAMARLIWALCLGT